MFIRFSVPQRDEDSDQDRGIFTALYELERQGQLAPEELAWFRSAESWLNKHLKRPNRMAWSTRPNAPKRAITWIKASATEHVSRLRELVALLDHKGIVVSEHRTEKPGYIVYEDDTQIAAMPFQSETF